MPPFMSPIKASQSSIMAALLFPNRDSPSWKVLNNSYAERGRCV